MVIISGVPIFRIFTVTLLHLERPKLQRVLALSKCNMVKSHYKSNLPGKDDQRVYKFAEPSLAQNKRHKKYTIHYMANIFRCQYMHPD